MNTRKLIVAALSAAFVIGGMAVASATELKKVSLDQQTQEFSKSDRPVFILSCNTNCKINEDFVKAEATMHPEWNVKWTEIDAKEFRTKPGLIVFVPGAGVTYRSADFDAGKADEAFWTKHVDFAGKIAAAVADGKAAQAKIDEASKGPNQQLADISRKDNAAYDAEQKELRSIRSQESNDKEISALNAQIELKSVWYKKKVAYLEKLIERTNSEMHKVTEPDRAKIRAVHGKYDARKGAVKGSFKQQEAGLEKQAQEINKAVAQSTKTFVDQANKARQTIDSLIRDEKK